MALNCIELFTWNDGVCIDSVTKLRLPLVTNVNKRDTKQFISSSFFLQQSGYELGNYITRKIVKNLDFRARNTPFANFNYKVKALILHISLKKTARLTY